MDEQDDYEELEVCTNQIRSLRDDIESCLEDSGSMVLKDLLVRVNQLLDQLRDARERDPEMKQRATKDLVEEAREFEGKTRTTLKSSVAKD